MQRAPATHRTPDLAATPAARPVRLEINNSGAWKIIARFDAGNEDLGDKASAAGQLLGEINPHATFRISTDEAMPQVLLRWDASRGWWIAASGRQWER